MGTELFGFRIIRVDFEPSEWWVGAIAPALDRLFGSPLFWPGVALATVLIAFFGLSRRRGGG